jgi:hypothetical protein
MSRRTAVPPHAKHLTLADFAALVGATPRWCQNALQTLGLGFRYNWELAQRLGLARLLYERYEIPLRRAMALSADALRQLPATLVRLADLDGVTALEVDVPRYLTLFALRTGRLRAEIPRRRGRPRRASEGGGVAAAAAYGLDLGALRSGLRLSPAERLRQLDANQRAIAALRRGRSPA